MAALLSGHTRGVKPADDPANTGQPTHEAPPSASDLLARLHAAEAHARELQSELDSTRKLASSGAALQAVVDDLEGARSPQEIVQRALRFAVEGCGAVAGLYFEHADDGLIYMRCAFVSGQVLDTPYWPGATEAQARFIALLFSGFRVDPTLLGIDAVQRTASAVQDHRTSQQWPEAHAWVLSMGWSIELNVPLVVQGSARGALSFFRQARQAFAAQDIAQAEALARQVAMAMQASRVGQQAHLLELAHARETATAARLGQQRRISGALQQLTEALATLDRLEDWIPRVLKVAADTLSTPDAAFFDDGEDRPRLRVWLSGGRVFEPAEASSPAPLAERASTGTSGTAALTEDAGAERREWRSEVIFHHGAAVPHAWLDHAPDGSHHAWELRVPLPIRDRAVARLSLYRPAERPFADEDVEVADAIARLVGVGIESARAAWRSRELAVVQERNRLAADIHDSLAQSFTSIALQCEVLGARLPEGSAEQRTAGLIERTARRGLAEARASVQALRSLPVGDDALGDALAELAEHCTVRGSIDCRFTQRAGRCTLSAAAQDVVLRVAQEASNNAMKHARCRTLELHLDWNDREVLLTVRDDGRGLPAEGTTRPKDSGGYGLPGMAQRAATVGGHCSVTSTPGQGVTVTLRLPRGG